MVPGIGIVGPGGAVADGAEPDGLKKEWMVPEPAMTEVACMVAGDSAMLSGGASAGIGGVGGVGRWTSGGCREVGHGAGVAVGAAAAVMSSAVAAGGIDDAVA